MPTLDFPPARGGIQTMAREILARAQRTSFRVIAPAGDGDAAFDATFGIPVRRARSIGFGRRGFVPSIALATRDEAARTHPDVALAMHVLAAPGALTARLPTVVVCHGGELRSSRIGKVARLILPL